MTTTPKIHSSYHIKIPPSSNLGISPHFYVISLPQVQILVVVEQSLRKLATICQSQCQGQVDGRQILATKL